MSLALNKVTGEAAEIELHLAAATDSKTMTVPQISPALLQKELASDEIEALFFPVGNSLFPYEQVFVSFEEAFLNYLDLNEESFLALWEKALGGEIEITSDQEFLNLAFEQLFDIPVNASEGELVLVSQEAQRGSVFSEAFELSYSHLRDDDDKEATGDYRITSVATQLSLDSSSPYVVSSPPLPTIGLPGGVPSAPSALGNTQFFNYSQVNNAGILPVPFISQGPGIYAIGFNSETILNLYPSVELTGNIFSDFHANFGPSSGPNNTVNIFFDPTRTDLIGATEDRSSSSHVILNTAEGNTLVFYIAPEAGHNVGDFIYILNQAITTPPLSSVNDSFGNQVFNDTFVYSLKDSRGGVSNGLMTIQILDDIPQATNQTIITAVNESDIENIGSNLINSPNYFAGSLTTDSTPTLAMPAPGMIIGTLSDNHFGADGGVVSSVSLTGVTGTSGVTQQSVAFTTISLGMGFDNANLGHSAIVITDSLNNTFTVDQSTGEYVYQLNNAFSNNVPNVPVTFTFQYAFLDNDGDSASAAITLTVNDDAPVAVALEANISEAAIMGTGTDLSTVIAWVEGELVAGIIGSSRYGADGAAADGGVSAVSFDSALGVSGVSFMSLVDVITDDIINMSEGDGFTISNKGNKAYVFTDTGGNQFIVDAITGQYLYVLNSTLMHTDVGDLRTATFTFNYTLTDGDGSSANSIINIVVADDAPVAVDESASFGGVAAISVMGELIPAILTTGESRFGADDGTVSNVIITDGMTTINPTTEDITVITQSGNQLDVTPTGIYTYQINNQYYNDQPITDIFTYTLTDLDGSVREATLTITGNPYVVNDYYLTNFDNPDGLEIPLDDPDTLLTGDLAANGYSLIVSEINGGEVFDTIDGTAFIIMDGFTPIGTLTAYQDGRFTYTLDQNADATFNYTVSDQNGGSAMGSAFISVIQNDTFTQVVDDPFLKLQSSASGSLFDNDQAAAGVTFTVLGIQDEFGDYQSMITRPDGVIISVTPTGDFTYENVGAPYGTEIFTYGISDNFGNVATGTVTVIEPADPVILDLGGDGLAFLSANHSLATLGMIQGDNNPLSIGWIGQNDGILVYDPTHSGKISDINQVSFYTYAQGAQSEMEALRAFDSNGDHLLNAQDSSFLDFGVLMGDGTFKTLVDAKVASISLSLESNPFVDNGNMIHGYTSFEMQSGLIHTAAEVTFEIGGIQNEALTVQDVLLEPELDLSVMGQSSTAVSLSSPEPVAVDESTSLVSLSVNDINAMAEQLNAILQPPPEAMG